jgi:hypothetical protein
MLFKPSKAPARDDIANGSILDSRSLVSKECDKIYAIFDGRLHEKQDLPTGLSACQTGFVIESELQSNCGSATWPRSMPVLRVYYLSEFLENSDRSHFLIISGILG